jgi:hypothetical protein
MEQQTPGESLLFSCLLFVTFLTYDQYIYCMTEIVLICVLIVKKHIEGTWSRKIGREVLEYTIL